MADTEGELLAQSLFGKAKNEYQRSLLDKVKKDLARGAPDQADESFRRMVSLGFPEPFPEPRLSAQQNETYLALSRKSSEMDRNGYIHNTLTDDQQKLLDRLTRMAHGEEGN